jgi:hypothetical protein
LVAPRPHNASDGFRGDLFVGWEGLCGEGRRQVLLKTPPSTDRDLVESMEASASTLVASKYSSSPDTRPARAHSSTILSKKQRKTSKPKRSRMRVSEEWSGEGSKRS